MTAQPYLRLEDPLLSLSEPGPFTSVRFAGNEVFVNGSSTRCAYKDSGGWHITDGAAMGDSNLTGQTFPVIFGQAK